MERARATWTDERLDDLSARVENGFSRVDEDLRSLRTEMNMRFDEQSRRFDSLQRLMVQFGGGLTLAVLATLISVVATRA